MSSGLSGDSATRTSVSPPSSAAGNGDERYVPGTLIGGRYRITGLLGRGGMGEVYRADDLKLGQTVALKFLPARLATNPHRLEMLLNEVRVARQISHPAVCRVYDVGESDGHHFISMEYIDGEDLSSLLRRIGRLPEDKALQMTRELSAGLAAAHAQGVLHRDLKPANVMLDGRGRARITDLGLAVSEDAVQEADIRSGTPRYMAPEQLAGREVTTKSDIYALGLVLYEVFTGRHAFEGAAAPTGVSSKTDPTSPSQHVSGLDPRVEEIVLRCLSTDPNERPPSALHVLSALPGSDPLAAALEAGETPSPEMVAAAPTKGILSPVAAWGWTAVALAMTTVSLLLSADSTQWPDGKAPLVLANQSREYLERLGHPSAPRHETWGYVPRVEYRDFLRDNPEHRQTLSREGRGVPYLFWYRAGPSPFVPGFGGQSKPRDPPRVEPGEAYLELDTDGNLVNFEVIPEPSYSERKPPSPEPFPWVLELAGLPPENFRPVAPKWRPTYGADEVFAWRGPFGASGIVYDVEVGMTEGRVHWLRAMGPWAEMSPDSSPVNGSELFLFLLATLFIAMIVGGALLAQRNFRSGRADVRGGLRVAAFVFIFDFAYWLAAGTHALVLAELLVLQRALAGALFSGAVMFLFYLGLEPEIRKRWPRRIVGWTRAVDGRFRDPLVGRDLLIGAVAGATFTAVPFIVYSLEKFWWGADQMLLVPNLTTFSIGARGVMGTWAVALSWGALSATGFFVIFLLLTMAVRREWVGVFLFGGMMFFGNVITAGGAFDVAAAVLLSGLMVLVMVRFGLLCWVAMSIVFHLSIFYPLSGDPGGWYFSDVVTLLAPVVGLAAYGAWVSSRRSERVPASP